jgi:hypothetical protein
MRLIQRPSLLPPTHPAGPLARWLAPADSGQPTASATTTNHREPRRHQPDLQHASAYSRPLGTQQDLQTSEMPNRNHDPSETPPISTAMPLTIRPCLLHYIHSELAWFAGTVRRHRHKGYDRLGDAFTTLPSEQPRPQPPHTHTHRGGLAPHQGPWRTEGPSAPPLPVPARPRAPASTRTRACAHTHCALPGPWTPTGRAFLMARTRGCPFPAEGYSKFNVQRQAKRSPQV